MDFVQIGIGLFAGFLIGFVFRRARIRQQVEPLKEEVERLTNELAAITTTSRDPQTIARPQRWTGTEIAAVLGAVGTILATLGGIYTNSQRSTVKDLETKSASLEQRVETMQKDRERIDEQAKQLLYFDLSHWLRVANQAAINPPAGKGGQPVPFGVDARHVSGPCADRRVPLTYNVSNPALLRCTGRVIIDLRGKTRIALIPDEPVAGTK